MKLVLASKNPHKLKELGDILSELGVEVLLESEAGVDVEVEETGTTFEENALLKADGIEKAKVSFATKTAQVAYDESKIDLSGISNVVSDAGYQVGD